MARGRSGRNQTTEAEREHRLQVHAAALAAGRTVRQIAEVTGVSVGQAAADRKKILEEWRKERIEDATAAATVAERRLDSLLAACWANAIQGDPASIGAALKIEERRARLLGSDREARVKIEASLKADVTTYNVAVDAAWIEVSGVLARCLQDHPELQARIADEIAALGAGTVEDEATDE